MSIAPVATRDRPVAGPTPRASATASAPGRWGAALTIGGPVALAAALSIWKLGTRSLWLDEGATVAIVSQHGGALWRAVSHDGGNMLAYYLVLHWIVGAFGDAAAVIRLPSVLANGATAAIVAILGLRLSGGDRRVAVTAALLSAVSLPLVFWGQDARGYAAMVTLASASFLALAFVLEAPAGGPAPIGALLAFGATLLGALYLGFDAVLIVPAQLAMLPAVRRWARSVLVTVVGVALLCVPLLVLAVSRGSSQLFWVSSPNLSVLGHTIATLTSAGYAPNFHHSPLTTAVTLVTVAGAAAALAAAWRARGAWQPLLAASWLVVPSVLGLVGAFAGEPIELQRVSILMIPALALVLAWALWQAPLAPRVAFGAVVVLLALRVAVLVPSYGVSPENWKGAVRHVLQASTAGSCVAFYPQDGRMPFDYYARGDAAAGRLTPVLPATPWTTVAPYIERYSAPGPAALAAIVARCPRLWLISAHEGQPGGPPASQRDYRRYRRLLTSLRHAYRRQAMKTFGYAAEVRTVLFSR